MTAHLHIDPLGGIAGDMFAAALIDLDPALFEGLVPLLRSVGLADDVAVTVVEHTDGILTGRRFVVDDPRERAPRKGPGSFVFQRAHAQHAAGHGGHAPFADIRRRIEASALTDGAKARAVDIFTRLARAEGAVHGIAAVDDVVFHEVGAQDSVADVVTAAVLLDRLTARHGALTATVASLPIGSGRVQTAHGELPVPAPATLTLLHGHLVHDDQRPGERVTPTGAAIVAHLVPDPASIPKRPPGRVDGTGTGFGTRTFVGLSNIVRVTLTTYVSASVEVAQGAPWDREAVAQITCDLDDMTGEELALAAEHVRGVEGVVDVVTLPCFMKKGRPATRLSVVCRPAVRDVVVSEIFKVTTTLGVRVVDAERCVLPREISRHGGARVKRATRPGGDTFKADVDDVPAITLDERRAARQAREDLARGRED